MAAEMERRADRDVEHDRWLRDRKVDVYTKFLEEVHDLELSSAEIRVAFRNDTGAVVEKTRKLSLLHMRVLAPDSSWTRPTMSYNPSGTSWPHLQRHRVW